MKKCPTCGRTYSNKRTICRHCGQLLETPPEDPNLGFRRRKPFVIITLLILILFAGGFGYVTYLSLPALAVLYPFFIATGIGLLVMLLLFPRAEDERPLGIVALSVYAVAIAFIIYALVNDCVVDLAASINYFKSLFQGGHFVFQEMLLNATAALLLLALIVSFIGFAVLARGVASIKTSLFQPSQNSPIVSKPAPSTNATPTTKTESSPEAKNHPFDLAGAISQDRKTSLAIETVALLLFLIVAGGSYYVYFAGYSSSLAMFFTAAPFVFLCVSLIFLALASSRLRSFYLVGALLGLTSALVSFTVLGFIVYEAILARSYADLFSVGFLIFAGEFLGLLLGGILGLIATIKVFGLRKRTAPLAKAAEPTKEEKTPKPSIEEMDIKGPLEVPTPESRSSFDGTFVSYLGNGIVNFLITFFTLGIAYPWVYCRKIRWRARHTVYEGYRVEFSGRGSQIAGPWLLWLLLSVVTLGVYGLWIPPKLKNFEAKNSRLVLE